MLEGKHALITGGGTGIGLAIAQSLAEAGATVTITGRRAKVLEEAAAKTSGLHPLVVDVTNENAVETAIAQATARHGPVQICIPNAGIAQGKALHKADTAHWRRIMTTNLDGAFWTIRACLGPMREAGWGRVIAISSVAGIRGLRGAPAYTASKHGLIGLIRGLSEDYMGQPLTFNALCPGYVDTDIVTRATADISTRAGISSEDALKIMTNTNRHKRLIAPGEVAAAALWLCGPGSESINGQAIEIMGGQA